MVHFLNTWGYVAIVALTFLSTMGLPVGSELAVVYGGVLASGQVSGDTHHLNLVVVMVVATAGELVGSLAGYLIGYYGGRPLVDRLGKYVLLTHRDLDRTEEWLDRRGEPFVFFGRLVPLIRSFVSLAGGLGEMAIGKFILFTVAASAIWCVALAGVGYSLGSSYEHVVKAFSYAGYSIGVLVVLAVIVVFLHRLRALRVERRASSVTPVR